MAKRRLREIPDVSEDYLQYAQLNPAYSEKNTDPRAMEDINSIFFKNGTNEPHDHNEIVRKLHLFQIAIREKIRQLTDNKTWDRKGGSTDRRFKASPPALEKVAQGTLTHPTERMAFLQNEISEASSFMDDIIIDPRNITKTLLVNLGLEEYLPDKGSRQETQLKMRAKAIPAVREAFKNLEPMRLPDEETRGDLKYFRLFRIPEGKNRGDVLGTQSIEGERKVLFKTSLYEAGRRLLHIEQGYAEETRKLKWIEMTLVEINKEFNTFWSRPGNAHELDTLRDAVMECANSLKHISEGSKKRLLSKIKRCLTPENRRRGPLQETYNELSRRHGWMGRILHYTAQDKSRLNSVVEEQVHPLQGFCNEVRKLHEQFRILKPPFSDAERDKFTRNLKARRRNAENLKYEPFLSFGEKFIEQIDKTISALREKRDNDAAREFLKIYFISKIARTHWNVQKVYKKMSLEGRCTNPYDLSGQIQGISDELRSHEVGKGINISDYNKSYGELYYLLSSLQKHLRGLMTPRKGSNVNAEDPQDAQTTLDGIFDEIIKKAPKLTKFMNRMRGELQHFVKRRMSFPMQRYFGQQSRTGKTYTMEQKLHTFELMKQRIKEFDFVELARELP